MLEVTDAVVGYGAITALHGVTLSVDAGSMVALVGANGAGKSTTLRAVSGLVRLRSGSIRFCGEEISRLPPHEIVRRGLVHVPEGRMIFSNLTVLENLRMGAYLRRGNREISEDLGLVLSLFPRLAEREKQVAGTLSGGEQQMLAIGRAMMTRPKLLMLDEPSLGIAPLLVKSIFETIVRVNQETGLTLLLVEQNAHLALSVSSFGYVLETGRLLLKNTAAALRADPQVQAAYLGG
ncbi:MAG: hypothetical protein RLZZ399_143 [Verrucomicrobiota bacterium]|jgi:branched-chain amino acid transport system ATP-binding protein